MGRWRISEVDLWDPDDIDLVEPAYIEFNQDQTGHFRFIAVQGYMDWRPEPTREHPHVEFSWEGDDEGDPVSGRGWATLHADGSLRGHIYFHMGDDSAFHALRAG